MFISHCGIMGTYEAIYFVKPLLCIPVDYDQFTNAAIIEELQAGMQLDHRIIDEKLLRSSVEEMANNKQLVSYLSIGSGRNQLVGRVDRVHPEKPLVPDWPTHRKLEK